MIHNLTIGHLDPDAIDERRAIVLEPLEPGLVRSTSGHWGGGTTPAGRWTACPSRKKTAIWSVAGWLVRGAWSREEFAGEIQRDTGCLIADGEYYRLVEPCQLEGLMERGEVRPRIQTSG